MLAFLSAHGNVPFSIALVIVIMLGTFELIAMIAGLTFLAR